MAVTVRELVTTWGFRVDTKALTRLDKKLKMLKKSARQVGTALNAAGGKIGTLVSADPQLEQTSQKVEKLNISSQRLNSSLRNLGTSFRRLRRSALVVGVAVGIAAAKIGLLVNEAAKLEQTEIAFEVLLGSAKEAEKRLGELFAFAKKTPFTIPGVLREAKRLLAFGFSGESLVANLEKLGNIAAGVGVDKLPFLVKAFSDVRSAGRLMGREVLQFVNAGVAIIPGLADQFNKTQFEIRKMIEQGKISFGDVDELLTKLTTGEGRFADLMVRQSKTFLGLLSNIKDAIILLAADIGGELLPAAKELASEFLIFLEVNKEIIKTRAAEFMKILAKFILNVFKVLKATIAVFKPFVMLLGGAENALKALTLALTLFLGLQIASFLGTAVIAVGAFTASLTAATVAALALNAAVALIPVAIGLIVVAIGLIIEDIVAFFSGKDSVTGLIVEAFKNAFGTVANLLGKLEERFNSLPRIFQMLAGGIIGILTTPLRIIKGVVESVIEVIKLFRNQSTLKDVALKIGKTALNLIPIIGPALGAVQGARGGLRGALGIGPSGPPTPQAQNSNVNNTIRVDSPITVQVPEGTPTGEIGERIQEGVSNALTDVFRVAVRANGIQVAF